MTIQGFCDSDHAGDWDTWKSVAGYVIYVFGCMVAWKSKSQKLVALSSSEAEYISTSEITKHILFVTQILEFLGQTLDFPINVKVDNISAIYMADNNMSRCYKIPFCKRINWRWNYQGWIVRSENNDSDIFTKNLGRELFTKHSKKSMTTEYSECKMDTKQTTQDGHKMDTR